MDLFTLQALANEQHAELAHGERGTLLTRMVILATYMHKINPDAAVRHLQRALAMVSENELIGFPTSRTRLVLFCGSSWRG